MPSERKFYTTGAAGSQCHQRRSRLFRLTEKTLRKRMNRDPYPAPLRSAGFRHFSRRRTGHPPRHANCPLRIRSRQRGVFGRRHPSSCAGGKHPPGETDHGRTAAHQRRDPSAQEFGPLPPSRWLRPPLVSLRAHLRCVLARRFTQHLPSGRIGLLVCGSHHNRVVAHGIATAPGFRCRGRGPDRIRVRSYRRRSKDSPSHCPLLTTIFKFAPEGTLGWKIAL